MPTIPTGKMERELRAMYLRWVSGLSVDSKDITGQIDSFQRRSVDLIERMGGATARLGALAHFPAPKRLDLSPRAGVIYDPMKQAAVQAAITLGLNSREAAQAMFRAGLDKSYRRLERFARTETVSAYWQNAWGSVADLPMLVMLWGAEDGPRTCPWCRERDGLVIDSPNLRDHPNGRCTPIPTLRSQVEYRGSVRSDGEMYHDSRWDKKPIQAKPVQAKEVKVSKQLTSTEQATPGPTPESVATTVPPTQPRIIKSMKDMDNFAAGMPAPSTLGANAAQVMDDYAKGTAYTVNAVLRGQKTYRGRAIDARTKAYSKKFTKDMDKIMDQSIIPEDVRVVRAVQADAFGGIEELQKLVGGVYRDKGYMSTSLAEKVSADVYNVKDAIDMEITVPKGTRAAYMAGESYLRSERELLLDRGTNLAVQSVTFDERTKKWKMIATVIPGPR